MKAEYFFKYPFYSQTSNHPQEDLAKFGYRLDMKAENPVVQIWQFIFFISPKSVELGSFFFHKKNPLHVPKSYFSGQKIQKIVSQKTNTLGTCVQPLTHS
jgi:hypothetical protein